MFQHSNIEILAFSVKYWNFALRKKWFIIRLIVDKFTSHSANLTGTSDGPEGWGVGNLYYFRQVVWNNRLEMYFHENLFSEHDKSHSGEALKYKNITKSMANKPKFFRSPMSFLNGEYSNGNGHIKPSPPPPPLQEEVSDQDISVPSDDTITPGCEIYSQLGEIDTGEGGHTSIFFGDGHTTRWIADLSVCTIKLIWGSTGNRGLWDGLVSRKETFTFNLWSYPGSISLDSTSTLVKLSFIFSIPWKICKNFSLFIRY